MEVGEGVGQRSTRSIAYIVPVEFDCEEANAVNQPDERDDFSEGTVAKAVLSDSPAEEAVPSDSPVAEEAVPSGSPVAEAQQLSYLSFFSRAT